MNYSLHFIIIIIIILQKLIIFLLTSPSGLVELSSHSE